MSNEKQSLGIKTSTVTVFLNDKLTQSCIEKYSSIEVNLNPVENEFEPYSKFKDIINVISKNKRSIKT